MNFNWKPDETLSNNWAWNEIQKCNPKATSWGWDRVRKGELYALPERCIKVVILGSPEVGKSSLLWNYFDECHGPTASVTNSYDHCEVHLHNMAENGVDIPVYFYDTSQVENFFQLKEEVYRGTSVIIYCYAIDDSKSFTDLLDSWIPHSRAVLGIVPSILVGNMSDLRSFKDNRGRYLLIADIGEYMKNIRGINRFYECSIEDGDTPQHIFQTALRLALKIEI